MTTAPTAAEFWDDRYRDARVWSGRPNAALVREVADLAPGTALDVGSGEGGDAIWLAEQGWDVTAVDVSQQALDRAAQHAAERGVGGRVRWICADLDEDPSAGLPAGAFDLVTSAFLHSPVALDRGRILVALPALVAPGGVLLVVGHADFPPWARFESPADRPRLPRPAEVLADLALGGDWTVEVVESVPREATGPDGAVATLVDAVVRARHAG